MCRCNNATLTKYQKKMSNFETECQKYAKGLEYKTYVEELFDGQEKFFGELRVDGTYLPEIEGLEDVRIMLVNNGNNEQPIAVDITAMVSEEKFAQLLGIANNRIADHLDKIFKNIYESMP